MTPSLPLSLSLSLWDFTDCGRRRCFRPRRLCHDQRLALKLSVTLCVAFLFYFFFYFPFQCARRIFFRCLSSPPFPPSRTCLIIVFYLSLSLSACAFFFQLAQRFDKRGTKNSENYLLHSVVVVYFLPTVTTVKYKSNKNNTAATATLTATAEAVTVNALSGLAA